MTEVDAAEAAATFGGQDPEHELMPLFARALRELGEHVRAGTAARSSRSPAPATGSAVALGRAARRACPRGSTYRPTTGCAVPFFKRAQLAAADLHLQRLAPAADLAVTAVALVWWFRQYWLGLGIGAIAVAAIILVFAPQGYLDRIARVPTAFTEADDTASTGDEFDRQPRRRDGLGGAHVCGKIR